MAIVPGPKIIEVTCKKCGEEYADSIVDIDYAMGDSIDYITDPENCECFGVRYEPVRKVLQSLDKGLTFQEMVRDLIRKAGLESNNWQETR